VTHPLADLLRDAARGIAPPADGTLQVLPAPPGRTDAVVAFAAHAVVAANVSEAELVDRLPLDDFGATMDTRFLTWLGERLGSVPGMIDLVLVAPQSPEPDGLDLARRDDLAGHPRIARSLVYREENEVYGAEDGAVVLAVGRGLARRLEVTLEIAPALRGRGLGRRLAAAAVRLAPDGEPLFAQVTPGNVASLRAFLGAGYRPIGSEVLFLRREVSRP
jgi:GNAT superfamily N-acetyltransferase